MIMIIIFIHAFRKGVLLYANINENIKRGSNIKRGELRV